MKSDKRMTKKLMVSHGKTIHPLGAKCGFCKRTLMEFNKEMKKPSKEHKEIIKKIEEMKSPIVGVGDGNDYYSGYNKAIDEILELIKKELND